MTRKVSYYYTLHLPTRKQYTCMFTDSDAGWLCEQGMLARATALEHINRWNREGEGVWQFWIDA